MRTTLQRTIVFLLAITFGLTFLSGCKKGENPKVDGVDGPYLSLFQDNLMISTTFENLGVDAGLRFQIPRYPHSFLELAPELSGGTLMNVSISLDDILNGNFDDLDPLTLPGGRPLPGVSGGTLPAVAFNVEKWKNMAFYMGPDVFGVFIPVDLDLSGTILTSRYFMKDGTPAGNISIVSNDEMGENGGILLLLDLKKYKSTLEKIARKY